MKITITFIDSKCNTQREQYDSIYDRSARALIRQLHQLGLEFQIQEKH